MKFIFAALVTLALPTVVVHAIELDAESPCSSVLDEHLIGTSAETSARIHTLVELYGEKILVGMVVAKAAGLDPKADPERFWREVFDRMSPDVRAHVDTVNAQKL